jgi:hypothetical protein
MSAMRAQAPRSIAVGIVRSESGEIMAAMTLANFLRDSGLATEAMQGAIQPVLRSQGMFLKGQHRLDATMQQRVKQCLEQHTLRHCAHPTCVALAAARVGERTALVVDEQHCEICDGSNQRRAIRELYAALRAHGITRLLIVGGTRRQHQLLDDLACEEGIELRTVDGSGRAHSQREAIPRVAWAQMLVIWSGTPLGHKVSIVYEQAPPPPVKVTIDRPGIEALCHRALAVVQRRATGARRQVWPSSLTPVR